MESKNRLITEFMPAALEIQAAPPPKFARGILWTLVSLFFIAVLWACFGTVDIVSVAQGRLVPDGKVKVIQPLQAGIISEIHVVEGQKVSAGEALVTLDSTIIRADVDRLTHQIVGAEIDIQNNQFLLDYAGSDIRSDIPNKQNLFLISAVADFRAQLLSFEASLAELEAEKNATEVNVSRYQKTIPIIEQRAAGFASLNQEQLVATDQYLQIEQQRIEQREALAYEKARVTQINASIIAQKKSQEAFVTDYIRQKAEEVVQLKRELQNLKQELRKASQTDDQQLLVSPVNGIVAKLAIATVGGVVTSAQELMHIVPEDQKLIVDAGLQNKDIGFVEVGQIAEIKLAAFPFTKYGVIDAQIMNVSADAIEDENLGLIFPIRARLNSQQIWVNHRYVNLQPGMQASVEIKTGKRRIIEFLLAPVLKGLNEGIRER